MAPAINVPTFSLAFGTVSFFMTYGERSIRVDLGQDILARLVGSPHKSKSDRIELLMRYRSQFAHIAAAKYDEGKYEHEVKVIVVRISLDDVFENAPSGEQPSRLPSADTT